MNTPFTIAAKSIFKNPHFTESFTIPGKGTMPGIRGQEVSEEIRSKFGIYEEITMTVTLHMDSLTVTGIPRKGDVCFFDIEPDRRYMVLRSITDAATQTVDVALGEYLV